MTEEAFLAAILADPDDDMPRLVYADWLDEHGHSERSEFIRVQVVIAELDREFPSGDTDEDVEVMGGSDVERYRALRSREQELLGQPDDGRYDPRSNDHLWAMASCPVFDLMGGDHEWRRGFVESVRLSWEGCNQHLDAVLLCQPVREVALLTWPVLEAIGDVNAGRGGLLLGDRHLAALSARWPQIKPECWHLPPQFDVAWLVEEMGRLPYRDVSEELMRRLRGLTPDAETRFQDQVTSSSP